MIEPKIKFPVIHFQVFVFFLCFTSSRNTKNLKVLPLLLNDNDLNNETTTTMTTIIINKFYTSGFKSLCTTPRPCMNSTADASFLIIWLASTSLKFFFFRILSKSSPPPSNSKTKYVWNCKT